MSYETVTVETRGKVGVITLDRPQALNALSTQLCLELARALDELEGDEEIGCIVLAGSEKAFAAGADIKEMKDREFPGVYETFPLTDSAARLARTRLPVVAAVSGYALGGGCELAMACDLVIAAETAQFGQPEITLGTIPGLGGTQRLTRAVGKAKAMDLVLTGRRMDAAEAERAGLVSRVVAGEALMDEALAVAETIAGMSRPIAKMAKECVNRAFETPLEEGLRFERRVFDATFATADRKEGMTAFVEKRKPQWQNR